MTNQTPPKNPLPESEIALSENPFSQDYEITMLEKSPAQDATDTEEDMSEITQISDGSIEQIHETRVPPAKPAQTKQKPAQPKDKPKSNVLWQSIMLGLAFCLACAVFLGVIYVVQIWLPETKPQPAQAPIKQKFKNKLPENLFPPQDHNISVSTLAAIGNSALSSSGLPSVYLGESLQIGFSLQNWQTPPQKNLNFHVSCKIFDATGTLIYHMPRFKSFSDLADAKKEEIVIESTVKILSKTPPGLYNLVYEVIDDSSEKSQTLQTRFRVLSRKP